MDCSSPLSSPPASSVLGGYESDRHLDDSVDDNINVNIDVELDVDHNIDRDVQRTDYHYGRDRAPLVVRHEASSEIDLVLTSPRASPPPPVLPQTAAHKRPRPRKSPIPPSASSKSASPVPLPQIEVAADSAEVAAEIAPESATEATTDPVAATVAEPSEETATEIVVGPVAEPLVEAAAEPVTQVDGAQDEQLGGEDARHKAEEPDNAIVVGEANSSPHYTANTFAVTVADAVARSPSPSRPTKSKEGQQRGGKTDKQKQETTKTAGTEEPPVQRSRARPSKESKPAARTPGKAASKPDVVVDEDDERDDEDRPKTEAQKEANTEPAAETMPAVTTTRSGRRVVQKHYGDDSSPPSAKMPIKTKATAKTTAKTPTRPLAKSAGKVKASPANSAAAAVMRRRKQAAARWQTDFVLANTKSPLINFDLRTLLCQPEAWDALDPEEQQEMLSLLPPSAVVVDGRPDIPSLKNDNNFRHDCARYRSDLEAGFYNKQWLEEAFEAHAMRTEGFFDTYVLDTFESSWGVQVPEELKREQRKEEKKKIEAKDIPKTSLKRSRRPSKAEEAKNDGSDGADTAIEAKTTNQSTEQDETQPAEATIETDRSPTRQKQGNDNKDEDIMNSKEVEGEAQGQGEETHARFVLVLGSPVREEGKTTDEPVEPVKPVEPMVKDKSEVTVDTVEDAPTIPTKRKASVDIADAVDVPMRSRKRLTLSIGIAGEAQGQDDSPSLEESIKVAQ
jgi:hypothetical protein